MRFKSVFSSNLQKPFGWWFQVMKHLPWLALSLRRCGGLWVEAADFVLVLEEHHERLEANKLGKQWLDMLSLMIYCKPAAWSHTCFLVCCAHLCLPIRRIFQGGKPQNKLQHILWNEIWKNIFSSTHAIFAYVCSFICWSPLLLGAGETHVFWDTLSFSTWTLMIVNIQISNCPQSTGLACDLCQSHIKFYLILTQSWSCLL